MTFELWAKDHFYNVYQWESKVVVTQRLLKLLKHGIQILSDEILTKFHPEQHALVISNGGQKCQISSEFLKNRPDPDYITLSALLVEYRPTTQSKN